jgi:hypothetical protein
VADLARGHRGEPRQLPAQRGQGRSGDSRVRSVGGAPVEGPTSSPASGRGTRSRCASPRPAEARAPNSGSSATRRGAARLERLDESTRLRHRARSSFSPWRIRNAVGLAGLKRGGPRAPRAAVVAGLASRSLCAAPEPPRGRPTTGRSCRLGHGAP